MSISIGIGVDRDGDGDGGASGGLGVLVGELHLGNTAKEIGDERLVYRARKEICAHPRVGFDWHRVIVVELTIKKKENSKISIQPGVVSRKT